MLIMLQIIAVNAMSLTWQLFHCHSSRSPFRDGCPSDAICLQIVLMQVLSAIRKHKHDAQRCPTDSADSSEPPEWVLSRDLGITDNTWQIRLHLLHYGVTYIVTVGFLLRFRGTTRPVHAAHCRNQLLISGDHCIQSLQDCSSELKIWLLKIGNKSASFTIFGFKTKASGNAAMNTRLQGHFKHAKKDFLCFLFYWDVSSPSTSCHVCDNGILISKRDSLPRPLRFSWLCVRLLLLWLIYGRISSSFSTISVID